MSTQLSLYHDQHAIARRNLEALSPALFEAVDQWAAASTDPASPRREDLERDKKVALVGDGQAGAIGFFAFAGQPVGIVQPGHIKAWREYLESLELAPTTVYAKVSRLSAFFEWLKEIPAFAWEIGENPVKLARPKAPRAYQGESCKALSGRELAALIRAVKAKTDNGDLAGKRDYALLALYLATGLRRREVCQLRRKDIEIDGDVMTITTRTKGGDIVTTDIDDPGVKAAFLDYLAASGRTLDGMSKDDPLWLRHDRRALPGQALSTHGLAKRLKQHAEAAGIKDFHVHRLRHTFALLAGEEAGSIIEVQHELGHAKEETTRRYLQRIAVRRGKYSGRIARKLGL